MQEVQKTKDFGLFGGNILKRRRLERKKERKKDINQNRASSSSSFIIMLGARQSDVFFGERESGKDVRQNNATAVQAVANIVKSSLGPVGLDKACDFDF